MARKKSRKQKKKQISNQQQQQRYKQYEKVFYNLDSPSAFSGKSNLLRVLRSEGFSKGNDAEFEEWLKNQPSYTLFRPVRRNRKDRRSGPLTYVRGLRDQFQADLADMSLLSKDNDGYVFILCVIDCFSRELWLRPTKNKTAKEIAKQLADIFSNPGDIPAKLQSDAGGEFLGKPVQSLLKTHDVHFFVSQSNNKAAMIERVIRTIKTRLYRYFYTHRTTNWIDVLSKLETAYNNSRHSTIGIAPANVSMENEMLIWMRLYARNSMFRKPSKFKPGMFVRVARKIPTFEKGYLHKWSNEIFTVTKVQEHHNPAMYLLTDHQGEDITGAFNENELQQVYFTEEPTQIERVIKSKTSKLENGKTEKVYYVKWKNRPEALAQWIKSSELDEETRKMIEQNVK